jgi:hypothetical protein
VARFILWVPTITVSRTVGTNGQLKSEKADFAVLDTPIADLLPDYNV